MYITRQYSNQLNYDELKYFTDGLCEESIISNEVYLGKLNSLLKVKAELLYENWSTFPATGIEIKIKNPHVGTIDSISFDFTIFWGVKGKRYWIEKEKGWDDNPPTDEQREALKKAIFDYVNIYKEV